MQDMQTYFEKLHRDAVDCALIGKRATDARKGAETLRGLCEGCRVVQGSRRSGTALDRTNFRRTQDRISVQRHRDSGRLVSEFPRGYISPNFKVLTSNIPAREHRTPTHG